MILKEENDQLREIYTACDLHFERMEYAYSKISRYFPLNLEAYQSIDRDSLSYFDQMIYRFSKLQDAMGAKLVKAVLASLGEETRGLPFIDILLKAESLHILESANDWLQLREIRNILAHEYPLHPQDVVDRLNAFHAHYELITKVWYQVEAYIMRKFSYLIQ